MIADTLNWLEEYLIATLAVPGEWTGVARWRSSDFEHYVHVISPTTLMKNELCLFIRRTYLAETARDALGRRPNGYGDKRMPWSDFPGMRARSICLV